MMLRNALWTRLLLSTLVSGWAIGLGGSASYPERETRDTPSLALPEGIWCLEPGWGLRAIKAVPEDITSLAVSEKRESYGGDWIFAGTEPLGHVYRFDAWSSHPEAHTLFARGMGDEPEYGTSGVSGLAVHDLDHDGVPELLAWTSQVFPIGRPRLYVWSMTPKPQLRGIARPDIRSSWSHGLGIVEHPNTRTDSVLFAYCGYGEILEYQLSRGETAAGLHTETLAWKQVGQLPASGESAQTADVDNDGEIDLCVATGYCVRNAAIHIYSRPESGRELRCKQVIDEGKRFGNVRFRATRTGADGMHDLYAWWCTGLADGDCEMIRYRIGTEGIRERTPLASGDAAALWPMDGQTCVADVDHDGRTELWFATHSGYLWRHDPGGDAPPTQVLHADGGIGPITAAPVCERPGPFLVLGVGRHLLRLERTESGGPAGDAR